MAIPDVLLSYTPEAELEDTDYIIRYDPNNDPYIVLTYQTAQPFPFDPLRPGYNVMMHYMNENRRRGPIDDVIKLILEQGFLSPRCYASFSAGAWNWIFSDTNISFLVFHSPSRWSREDNDDYGYSPWREAMIGVTQDEAQSISPQAVTYFGKKGHVPPEGHIWAFLPPQHLIGVVDFNNKTEVFAFYNTLFILQQSYEDGNLTELDVVESLQVDFRDLSPYDCNGALSRSGQELLWTSVGASLTEEALFRMIDAHFHLHWSRRVDRRELRRLSPCYPFTESLLAEALSFSEKEFEYMSN